MPSARFRGRTAPDMQLGALRDHRKPPNQTRRSTGSGGMTALQHVYEIRPRKDKRGVDLISAVLPFGRLWYGEPDAISNAIGYANFFSRSHDAVIRVYDDAHNVIEMHKHESDFREW